MGRRWFSGWFVAQARHRLACALVAALACALVAALAGAGAVTACSGRAVGPPAGAGASTPGDDGGAYGGGFPATAVPDEGDDDDAPDSTTAPPSAAPSGDDDADGVGLEASTSRVVDAGPDGACAGAMAAGALRIDELMIESVAGSGDDGEWLEIESTLGCAVNLNGLHGECPRGSKVATFDVDSDVWIPPRGTFVVADSSDPAIDHDLPGVVVAWFGHPGDVLRNLGTTVTLRLDGTLIDSVTYPALSLAVGTSVEFPSDCDAGLRSDFTQWKRSTTSWFPGFFGTPNAPNDDVQCP
jgi:hypothetical protein